jgi:hypothetical protein
VVFRRTASHSASVGRVRRLSGLDGCRPATEELQPLRRARTGLGSVGEDRQPVIRGEVQPVVAQAELTGDRMVEVLDAGVVEAHVVRSPTGTERLAVCCELADEV